MGEENRGDYASVNGLNLYYEVHGDGQHLILLHGGLGAVEMFGEVLSLLAEGRRVIGVDLQAHGGTADVDRPMTFEAMADDVAALFSHLGLEEADVMGLWVGGSVALQTAIRHPEAVRKVVLVSAPFKRDGWYPEVLTGMAQMGSEAAEPMKETPMNLLYAGVAPRPEDWPVLLTKLGDLLREDYDWSDQVEALQMPVMIVVGDADSVPPTHVVEFFGLLGRRQEGRGMARLGEACVEAIRPAWYDALRYLPLPRAGVDRRAVPQCARRGGGMSRVHKEVTCPGQ